MRLEDQGKALKPPIKDSISRDQRISTACNGPGREIFTQEQEVVCERPHLTEEFDHQLQFAVRRTADELLVHALNRLIRWRLKEPEAADDRILIKCEIALFPKYIKVYFVAQSSFLEATSSSCPQTPFSGQKATGHSFAKSKLVALIQHELLAAQLSFLGA